ncbi:GntR family transcriptional regulator [Rhizobium sp. SSA_523]|uniref:GntR family transcriptional regulator n=1 Tax=Rhizobium sp. SSA_523 TaxID=2952477 RepID=UPI0020913000|nr:GntR family transcriptional regulator [Rhizobium sp. SSA_523]MCO5733426.1 GntR family transcriptional regulator [Rhizobium sp. SSA_523]WKC21602.1 GntR family transcriptional regulator [Rhizobium sp. SSA_523]
MGKTVVSDLTQGTTQTMRAVLTLRDMIANGQLQDDTRYTEVQLADLLSMSRTPIRAALQKLTDEGVLQAMPAGGYTVRRFLPSEINEAIEIRGMLEGLCVRLLAERGVDAQVLADMGHVCDGIEAALISPVFNEQSIITYSRLNAEFHKIFVEACNSQLLQQELARANARPFGSASALVGIHTPDEAARRHLWIGHDQHRAVIDAIATRQGGRAEQIMREHARLSQRNLTRALNARHLLDGLEGATLIRQSGS